MTPTLPHTATPADLNLQIYSNQKCMIITTKAKKILVVTGLLES
jgi:hypothetical protein